MSERKLCIYLREYFYLNESDYTHYYFFLKYTNMTINRMERGIQVRKEPSQKMKSGAKNRG